MSLISIDMRPTTNPVIGPPMMPAVSPKKATGFTFGGPPANTTLEATLRAVKDAMRVNVLVNDALLPGFNETLATARKP